MDYEWEYRNIDDAGWLCIYISNNLFILKEVMSAESGDSTGKHM